MKKLGRQHTLNSAPTFTGTRLTETSASLILKSGIVVEQCLPHSEELLFTSAGLQLPMKQ